jgi:hypothetical protein
MRGLGLRQASSQTVVVNSRNNINHFLACHFLLAMVVDCHSLEGQRHVKLLLACRLDNKVQLVNDLVSGEFDSRSAGMMVCTLG